MVCKHEPVPVFSSGSKRARTFELAAGQVGWPDRLP